MLLSGQRPARQLLRHQAIRATTRAITCAIAASVLASLACVSSVALARQSGQALAPNATIQLSRLPFEARSTYRMILRGGPFPYPKDGVVFGNRERMLPPEQRGYYREYTVRTPMSADRGARRIVCGGRVPAKPETCFYTSDHYASFLRIVP